MLIPSDYQLLVMAIERSGAIAYTSVANYLATHYLPNWYDSIADFTPETKFYPCDDRLEHELSILVLSGINSDMIKDEMALLYLGL